MIKGISPAPYATPMLTEQGTPAYPWVNFLDSLLLAAGILRFGDLLNRANVQSFIQTAPSVANGQKRVIYADNIYWDESQGKWVVQVPGSTTGTDWAAMVMLANGVIGFASETGLTLPTTRTDAQFNSAIHWTVDPTGPLWSFKAGANVFTIQVGSGSPAGVVNAPGPGALYSDVTGGELYRASAAGTASWLSLVTVPGITQLTGDVTAGPGSGSQAATLATVTTAHTVPLAKLTAGGANGSITFDAKGRRLSSVDPT